MVRISAHVILFVAFFGLMSLLVGCIGDRGATITYHNNTDEIVLINLDILPKTFSGAYELDPKIVNRGPIKPEESRRFTYVSIPLTQKLGERIGNYVISAITLNGTTIYQQIFTWTELQSMNWTIVISPQTK